jgi:tRNA G26 N,N-dimethylase Trm1
MIRSREKCNRRHRRVTRERAPRDHHDEPLRVLVRVLARQAARERFEREVAGERETQPEVTLH